MDGQEYLEMTRRIKEYNNIQSQITHKESVIHKLSGNNNYVFKLKTPQDCQFEFEINEKFKSIIVAELKKEIKLLKEELETV